MCMRACVDVHVCVGAGIEGRILTPDLDPIQRCTSAGPTGLVTAQRSDAVAVCAGMHRHPSDLGVQVCLLPRLASIPTPSLPPSDAQHCGACHTAVALLLVQGVGSRVPGARRALPRPRRCLLP